MISIVSCRICSLSDHIRHAIDLDILASTNDTAIGRKWAKEIARSQPRHHVNKHRPHVGKEPKGREVLNPGVVAAKVEEKHRKTVDERIDEMYNLSLAGCSLAIKKPEPDLRGLATCIAQGIAATALMGKSSDPNQDKQPKESAFWKSYMNRAGEVFEQQT